MSDTQQFVKSQKLHTYDKVREALVHTVLEKTLHSAGIYQTITSEIERTYDCSLYDCYEHPEYFSSILENKHREMYDLVTGAINKQLEMFSHEKPIARFLQAISS